METRPNLSSSDSCAFAAADVARVFPLPYENQPTCNENGIVTTRVVEGAIQRLAFIDALTKVVEWKDIDERFDQIVSTKNHQHVRIHPLLPTINRSDFGYCIGMNESPDLANELIGVLTRKKNGYFEITKQELHKYWCRITNPSFNSRIEIFVDLCERNTDTKINGIEIKQIILAIASTNKLSITHEEAEEYAVLIMEGLDSENLGYTELSQLKIPFKEGSSKSSLLGDQNTIKLNTSSGSPYYETMSAMEVLCRTYWRRAWIIIIWLIVCFALFTWKFMQYRNRMAFEVMGYCLCTAKGAAETLKFNMALILLPVCRNTITWLRKNPLMNSIIPFNDNINFHKLIAGGIVIGVILHGGTHLTCDFPRIAGCSKSIFRSTIGTHFQNHQPSYIEMLETTEAATGIAMVVLMAVAFGFATKLPRRQPSSLPWPLQQFTGFNTFWYSHHLFIFVYVLLIVHSMFLFLTKNLIEKTTWMYIAIPVLLYASERVVRAMRSGFYNVQIFKAKTYLGKVLSLKLTKPAGFRYRSGMYICIQCPKISKFEWHPFSLTSAPDDDHLSVHIRTLGDWSYQIYSLFQEALLSGRYSFPKICIDGPYGAAAQDHVKYDIVMLIGLGIGVTPFVSVIRDIVHGLHKTLLDSINDEENSIRKGPSKIYLYWVTREKSSFDWFRDVMKEISETDRKQSVIEMHNFLTSVYGDGDVRSALMTAIQVLHYVRKGIDIISRTPVQTHFSRPNWLDIFSSVANRHAGAKIGVFYCGPSVLARELERLCTRFTTKTTTRFVFHKEHY